MNIVNTSAAEEVSEPTWNPEFYGDGQIAAFYELDRPGMGTKTIRANLTPQPDNAAVNISPTTGTVYLKTVNGGEPLASGNHITVLSRDEAIRFARGILVALEDPFCNRAPALKR